MCFTCGNVFLGVGNATACVLNDRIYVTGGHYGYRGTCTYEKIQMYRPDTNEWSIATICPHPGNIIYLIGQVACLWLKLNFGFIKLK